MSSYFCSELVAETYMVADVMVQTPEPSNEYTPADFAGDNLPLRAGYYLGDMCAKA